MKTASKPRWDYITSTRGPRGWHVVRRRNDEGGVVTVCGVAGWVITLDEPQIIACDACTAQQTST